ncbi:E3 ubiquitin-protein ligase TRIM17-like isoform X1 [Eriocheir sinensis]|uniref:E3 ubiquitin-protein ligase TRIM17-like isoform X1 n=1 Tax=Eriocheir sinensis TaxID=95602 RepID=UPI0021C6C806|nr:E3 ubiquitin-protein ligase TRIM17-like isoform X1 [Eriocheir sinensis]XP_050738588.1 E3 ubiquitin-protein ligase TRIM17-like isoform X1 [Eriocheir sinensis]
MDVAVTCSVCFRVYQQGTRDPLVLPCGHTFCRVCVNAVHDISGGSLPCPTCRSKASISDVSKLPICYPLVGLSSSYSEIKFGSCTIHEEEQRFWCTECELALCSLCLYASHQHGHEVMPTKVIMENKKKRLHQELERLNGEVLQGRSEINYIYEYLTTKMKQVLNLEEKVDLLSADVQDACSVEDILVCEDKLKLLDEENELWLPNKSQEIVKKMKDMNINDAAFEEDAEASSHGIHASLHELAEEDYGAGRMRLDYREGRLLMHSTAHPADGHLSFQVPSEVFLELAVGGSCLGRVYISLWTCLRRAQQFFALCMGTMGPSYIGSTFSHVAYQGHAKETLCCEEYVTESGEQGTKELMADLEWGDEYRGEPRTGLLIPLSKFVDQHGFGICTKGRPGGSFNCPFGEVVAGMEVVLAAVRHHPVTDVTITHCGLVLPRLSV